jgi:hypothetical protein
MSPETLEEMYRYAWKTFYQDMSQSLRMARLFSELVKKEMADGTYQSMKLSEERKWAGN